MKLFRNHFRALVLFIPMITLLTACNKDDQDVDRAMQILVSGYNGSVNPLQIAIDTTAYTKPADLVKPASLLNLYTVFPYKGQKERFLTITDTVTKKVLYRQVLPTDGSKGNFSFIYLDGKELEVKTPAADPATNKLAFYIRYTDNNDPFDIFLYRKDEVTGMEYRHYLARNVKPGSWIYADYLADEHFDASTELDAADLLFTKAGTTDQWAFRDAEFMSKTDPVSMAMPKGTEKGLVLPYFIIPGPAALQFSRLFFVPDRFYP